MELLSWLFISSAERENGMASLGYGLLDNFETMCCFRFSEYLQVYFDG
jgi:hypothetical protein